MMHDVAKEMPHDQAKKLMKKYYASHLDQPEPIWHQWLSRYVCENEFLISDEEILNTTKRIKEGLKDIENIPIDNAININKKVQSENLVETKTDGVGDIIQASYQGVSQALRENKTKERQPVNVYIGNRKVYSGYGNYLNSENNMYGTSTIRA